MEEVIKYKPAETIRICKCGCGEILLPRQKMYASLQCLYKSRARFIEIEPDPEMEFPIWRCSDCGKEIQLNFMPKTNIRTRKRFIKIVNNHKCDDKTRNNNKFESTLVVLV